MNTRCEERVLIASDRERQSRLKAALPLVDPPSPATSRASRANGWLHVTREAGKHYGAALTWEWIHKTHQRLQPDVDVAPLALERTTERHSSHLNINYFSAMGTEGGWRGDLGCNGSRSRGADLLRRTDSGFTPWCQRHKVLTIRSQVHYREENLTCKYRYCIFWFPPRAD